MSIEDISRLLEIILNSLSNADFAWRVDGSANLAIQGIELPVNDLDITTDEEGIMLFKEALGKYIVDDFFNKQKNCKSLVCDINGFRVEINSFNDQRSMTDKNKTVLWKGLFVPILPLEYARIFYQQINRPEKVKIINSFLAQ